MCHATDIRTTRHGSIWSAHCSCVFSVEVLSTSKSEPRELWQAVNAHLGFPDPGAIRLRAIRSWQQAAPAVQA